ncbi:MAG: response regulator, partial [Myxococcota bacterium]
AAKERPQVLYVEDDLSVWDVTSHALGERYALTRATNAREAFHLLSKTNFDIILMDIELQGSELNGIEICQVIRGRYEGRARVPSQEWEHITAPIIFVTAYAARYSRQELLDAGGDERILKPVNFTTMSLAMSRLLVQRVGG